MPAESLRKTNESEAPISDRTSGLEFTATIVGWPLFGGTIGETGRRLNPPGDEGPFVGVMPAKLFKPFHEPPGIQPHPAPWQYDQLP